MSSKRDYEDEDEDDGEIPEPTPKRAKKHNPKTRQHQSAAIDPTWGQKYVFSSSANATTIPSGEESDFEDDTDAMAYLMSVRQEAGGIPHLLVAPKVQIGPQMPAGFKKRLRADPDADDDADEGEIDEDEEEELDRSVYTTGPGDTRGYYADGAYVGVEEDDSDASKDSDEDAQKALHNAYFASLMDQYLHLRTILNRPPPPEAAARLPSTHPTNVNIRNSSTNATWSRLLRTTDPHPLQLAAMSKDSVLRILRIVLGGKFLRQGYQCPERTSRWLWALLARLPDRGGLNHVEIGWVRDLGRRAVLMGRSLAEMAALRDELADGGLGVNEAFDGSSSDEGVFEDAEVEDVEGEDSPDAETAETGDEPQGQAGLIPPSVSSPGKAPDSNEDHRNDQLPTPKPAEDGAEDGEIEEDVAMDMSSDSESEATDLTNEKHLELVKARLLAQLEYREEELPVSKEDLAREEATVRARMNMRATLNMILTVAGDFYGQRDLLEFREPFVGM